MIETNRDKMITVTKYLIDVNDKYWCIDDPVKWCLNNIDSPLLKTARIALLGSKVQQDSVFPYVSRKAGLSLIEVIENNVTISCWGSPDYTIRYKPFFKREKLARQDVKVIYRNLKRPSDEPKSLDGSCFMYGTLVSDDIDLTRYVDKFNNRYFLDADDNSWVNEATNFSRTCLAIGLKFWAVRWFELKVAWRRFPTKTCANCDSNLVMLRFGRIRCGCYSSTSALAYGCPACKSYFKTTRLQLPEVEILNKVYEECRAEYIQRFGEPQDHMIL